MVIQMIKIELDHEEVRQIYLEELRRAIQRVEKDTVFWDSKELSKQTRMCWDTIQKEFFFDPRFPKSKVGRKWMYPAQKTKAFLLIWLDEQKE